MDFLDIFKSLAEEPDKQSSRLLSAAKLSINVILASSLYKYIIGPYKLINYSEAGQWVEYALSGRLLLSLVFFASSHMLLFVIGPDILFWPLQRFLDAKIQLKRPISDTGKFIRRILKQLKVVHHDKLSDKWVAGDNVDFFSSFIEAVSSEAEDSPVLELKHSILNDCWRLYFGFTTIYFFFLPYYKQTFFLNFLLVLGFIGVPVFYVMLSKLYVLSIKHREGLLRDVEGLKKGKMILETFKMAAMPITAFVDTIKGIQEEHVKWGVSTYILRVHFGHGPVQEPLVKMYQEQGEKRNMPILFLSDQVLTENANERVSANPEKIVVVVFDIEQGNLAEKLWAELKKAKSKNAATTK